MPETAMPGFVMLAHRRLDRAAEVARHLALSGCPVAVHVDARTSAGEHARMVAALADVPGILFVPRQPTPWGGWGLVVATEVAAAQLLADHPRVTHVALISGSCLPLRRVDELRAFLAARPGTDFIESVAVEDVPWAQGGLDAERFTLHFPFDWQRQRRLFDQAVAVQRRLGVRRRVADGIVPHLGSQWWCLTRPTLQAILSHPRRAELARYFARVWIPDESWFQTLARLVAPRIESRSLTFSRFDVKGRPRVFYDDHLQLLRATDCFLARKIWPGADGLYRHLLAPAYAMPRDGDPAPSVVEPVLATMAARRLEGRPGLWSAGRYPDAARAEPVTAAPHAVLVGVTATLPGVADWLTAAQGARVHGRLFAPDGVQFAGGDAVGPGGLSVAAALRDHDPRAFLRNLVWATRGEMQVWSLDPADTSAIVPVVAGDRHARVVAVTGTWVIGLWQAGVGATLARADAVALMRAEDEMMARLTAPGAAAQVNLRTLGAALSDPSGLLADLVAMVLPGPLAIGDDAPLPAALQVSPDLVAFVTALRDLGVPPRAVGDLAPLAAAMVTPPRARPRRARRED
jgi:hypothetical protein